MTGDRDGLAGFGGTALILSGVLFLIAYLLDVVTGPPPGNGAAILAWAETHRVPLAFVSEVLFFAAALLVPATIALYRDLERFSRSTAAFGCGVIAATIPVLMVMLILHGRLVYPIYGIRTNDPASAEFLIAVYFGGVHAIRLLFGGAMLVLAPVMRRAGYGAAIMYLGFSAGVLEIIGSYPDRIGPVTLGTSQLFFVAWCVAVGWRLHRAPKIAA